MSQPVIYDDFKACSIHLTSYSTTTFECSRFGIPTIFLKSLSHQFDMFKTDFHYPVINDLEAIETNYISNSLKVIDWQKNFISDFDEDKFISLLS